ncbi:MAG: FtsX-like permease family protein [Bacteroidetes bacterium]|jgi:putative ABC transport system permease protein|nr:MAG: FtsX-like permease family protein [Bacteroidota bacterium]
MIRRTIEIIGTSFKMAMQELWKNKLRTFLSLFGITIGILCIIGVLVVVNSLERNITNEIKSLGSNTIYVDKWVYEGGPDYPWWKYVNRPNPKYEEMQEIKKRTPSAKFVAFNISTQDNVDFRGSTLSNVNLYGISEEFNKIQPLEVRYGRYLSDAEFNRGVNAIVTGNDVAEKLFGEAELAVNKEVSIRGKKALIVGIIKKQGKQMIGGWDFDQSIIIPYRFAKTLMNEFKSNPVIMVQGQDWLTSKALKDDLTGSMRAIHRLSPTKEEDFALNDVNDLAESISSAFVGMNIGGAVIGGISLIVGLFGVANIMFVTVRERTSQIGLKKALGAKKRIILSEFLLESAFLCIIGGLMGLILVFLLSLILTQALSFPVFISVANMLWTFGICVLVGVIAGIIPAYKAAQMDPVEAIRSK